VVVVWQLVVACSKPPSPTQTRVSQRSFFWGKSVASGAADIFTTVHQQQEGAGRTAPEK
jgi:hypothetical protein